jgi:hypothetical protein
MNVTERDVAILEMLLMFGYLVTHQLRSTLFPSDKDGSVTRDRLRKLQAAGLITRRRAEVANPLITSTMPVWIITEQGICTLSLRKNEPRYLSLKPPCTRSWQCFAHFVAVADILLTLSQAVKQQSRVTLGDVVFEHTLLNADAENPAERYKLYTVVQEQPKRIVAALDAAFELQVGAFRRAYGLELERGTDAPPRIIAKKHQGHYLLNEAQHYRRWFPNAQDFRVIYVAPRTWCAGLRKAARDKPCATLLLFAAREDINAASILHGEIFKTVTEGPRPLVRPEVPPQRG